MKKKFIALMLAMVSFSLIACSNSNTKETAAVEEKEPEKIVYYTPLTHEERDEDQSKEKIFAVMLDNHDDARPQAAINQADIIYEYRVEGEFTRYMALFQSHLPENVGPVRSARPYFVQTAKEYDAIYTHWGGSEAGLSEVRSRNVVDLDGIALEGIVFHRNKDVGKRAPHNGYVSLPELKNYLVEKNVDVNNNAASLNFYEESENLQGEDVKEITLKFNDRYKTNFIYDEATEKYKYIRQGEPVIDENTKEEFTAKNLVVLFQKGVVAGPKGTLKIANIGAGDGLLLQNGKLIPITWEKENEDAMTIFKDAEGNLIKFHPGNTFISVVDDKNSAVYETLNEENTQITGETSNSSNQK
ncbi:DUF3048 domain-containing protein [Peptoniphilus sp. MSJ-1]|uniref:DUF3048 domain-containing protein n=1 Tax=Peptoniphilus ovalis TaxID=2841503 RepID=A0ABS6FIW9_9FIRM|nr:DUF3048 domain-containing protein [Peptoniphilus ovalis]MBU5670119.1 DUF3048 domain-containing protein [Peptoniphilus ovalis]